ncbi:MAG: DegT/DnrJ/EryC1/StrS family aminotransferase [Burkholderiales bacterium]|nr:MAG: DegT/DnrJ/EryC1/StrS family aminotransferase [Burkholderiales bacterium]
MIPQANPRASYLAQKTEIDASINRVMTGGTYLLGPETIAFEAEFAQAVGAQHAIGVANGTDALCLALRAVGVRPGDHVVTVSHTAVATAIAVLMADAAPAFVDIDPLTYTMSPADVAKTLSKLKAQGSSVGAIVPVHLYGHPADMDAIAAVAAPYGVPVIEDCAQALGASINGRQIGSIGTAAAHSFYPTKNLGAFGDGGAVTTNNSDVANRLRSLRQYGWRDETRVSAEPGVNSRLDELQAAILRVKLTKLNANIARRRTIAAMYNEAFSTLPVARPSTAVGMQHAFHLYVLRTERRDEIKRKLESLGIATAIHYATPAHLHSTFAKQTLSLPHTELAAQSVLSLPLYPELSDEQVQSVIDATVSIF